MNPVNLKQEFVAQTGKVRTLSQLSPLFSKVTSPKAGNKLLSHVEADFYISQAIGQEGTSGSKEAHDAMLYYLRTFPGEWITPALRKIIEEFEVYSSLLEKEGDVLAQGGAFALEKMILEEVVKLEPGRRYLINGGWIAEGFGLGHSLIYSIHKQGNGKYSFTVFNTGDGLGDFHPYQVDKEGYRRYYPAIVYQNIEEKALLEKKVLANLIDLRWTKLAEIDLDNAAHMIYDSLLSALGGELAEFPSDLISAMRAQRSGVCTYKVLNALLKVGLGLDEKTYKRLKLHVRYQALKDYLHKKRSDGERLTESESFHLAQDFEKFLRELKKEGGGLSCEEKEKYYVEIKELQAIAHQINEAAREQRDLHFSVPAPEDTFLLCFSGPSLPLPLPDLEAKETGNKQVVIALSAERPDKKEILTHLQKWVAIAENLYKNCQYRELLFSVNSVISNLPFPVEKIQSVESVDSFWGEWGECSQEEISEMIVQLTCLSELVFQSCFHLGKCHGEEILTATCIYCIQIKLLENLLNYQRLCSGRCLIGLGAGVYSAHSLHIGSAIQTNVFSHDLQLNERAKQCLKFLEVDGDFQSVVSLFTSCRRHGIEFLLKEVEDKGKLEEIRESIKKTAFEKNITLESEGKDVIDYALLEDLMTVDFGQFGLSPKFLSSLNKQLVIASYFLANGNFAARGPGSELSDAFTLASHSLEEMQRDGEEKRFPLIWIKGVSQGHTTELSSVCEIRKKIAEGIVNPDIRRCMGAILDKDKGAYRNPNETLTQFQQCKELPPEDAQELIALVNTEDGLIVWQTLSLFERSIDKFQERDYQILFDLCVFPRLEREIKKNPLFANDLLNFILKGMDEFQAAMQIDGYLFLLRLGMHLEECAPSLEKTAWLEILQKRFRLSASEAEKDALEAQIAHTLVLDLSLMPSLENVVFVLKGLSHLQRGKVPFSMMEQKVLLPVLEWCFRHDFAIKNLLRSKENVSILCNAIASDKDVEGWEEWNYPIYSSLDGQWRVNLLTGECLIANGLEGSFPRAIVENPFFSLLFGKKERRVKIEGFHRFYFSEGEKEFRVEKLRDGNLAIEQKIGDAWYRYLPVTSLPKEFPATMRSSYSHWIGITNETCEILIQDRGFDSHFVALQLMEKYPYRIFSYQDRRKILVSANIFSKEGFYLQCFEESRCIRGWVNKGKEMKEVHFPRYGLNFSVVKRGESSVCESKEFPGYWISQNQNLSLLNFVSSYLILENALGHKKVLIPEEKFLMSFSGEQFLKGKISSFRDVPYRFLEINLDQRGNPKGLNQYQALYIAYIALVHKDYQEADKFLRIAEGVSESDCGNLIEILCAFVQESDGLKIGDNHPMAKAIALRAGLLSLKNLRYKSKSSNPSIQKEVLRLLQLLKPIYSVYHAADLNAGYSALSPKEERKLLQELFNHHLLSHSQFDRLIYLQTGKELEPIVRKADGIQEDAYEKLVRELHCNWQDLETGLKKWSTNIDSQVWTDPKEQLSKAKSLVFPKEGFIPYFVHVCLHMQEYRENPELKLELENHLKFIRWTFDGIFFHHCLQEMLESPELYADQLQVLEGIAKQNGSIKGWMMGLAQHYRGLYRSKSERLPFSSLSLNPPMLLLPEVKESSSLLKGSRGSSSALWDEEDLQLLFEMRPGIEEEPLPDLKVEGVQEHQKQQILEFNETKARFYQNKPSVVSYHLRDPVQLKSDLEVDLAKTKRLLKHQKQVLLRLANQIPRDLEKEFVHSLEKEGSIRRDLTWEDLLVLYRNQSEEKIFSKCPGLEESPKLCKALLEGIEKYLILATEQQQRKRALTRLCQLMDLQKNVSEASRLELEEEIANVTADLYLCMKAQRVYPVCSLPKLLVFEYRRDILIREKQLEVLLQIDSGEESIEQLMMGEGKTKVITPLIADMRADGARLSLVIVPSFNYETNLQDLRVISKEGSFVEPLSFEFNRSTPFTKEELRNKLWSLQNAVLNGIYVITTAESLICLKLKAKEISFLVNEGKLNLEEAKTELELLKGIRRLIKHRGWALIDEPDDVLSVRREVNFPLGILYTAPKERTLLIEKIYEVLLGPEMEQWTHLRSNKPEAFLPSEFFAHVAPKIADHLIDGFAGDDIKPEDLKSYLLGQFKQTVLPGLNEHPARGLIALSKEMINVFIPSILTKKGNERFGLSHKSNAKYPIPYKANNVPEETAEIGNIYETLLFAGNIYSQDGLNNTHVQEVIEATRQKIRSEARDRGCRYSETRSFARFVTVYEVKDPFALSLADFQLIAQSVTEKHRALFEWLDEFVYPEVKTTKKKINANALTLVEMLAHVTGFTATPWNRQTFHRRLHKKGSEGQPSIPESDMRILHAIYQKVKEGGLSKIDETTSRKVLDRLLESFQFDCLIDLGALLNGITNDVVAKELLAKGEEDFSGVIYFNDKNELVVQLKGLTEPVLLDEAYGKVANAPQKTYYDEFHTAGADIKQRPKAKAILTFGKNFISQLTQAAMRMRRLLSSQSIEIVFPEEIKNLIAPSGEGVSFDALIEFAIIQQTDRLADDLVRFVKMDFQHSIRSEIDALIDSEEDWKKALCLEAFFESVSIDSCSDDDYEQFAESFGLEDSHTVLEAYRQERISAVSNLMREEALEKLDPQLHQILSFTREKIIANLKNTKLPSLNLLFSKIPRVHLKQKLDSQVEVEKELEMFVESKTQSYTYHANLYQLWGKWGTPVLDNAFFTPNRVLVPRHCPAVVSLDPLLPKDSGGKSFAGFFDPALYTTKLFYQTVDEQREALFGVGSQKHLYQFVFIVEEDGTAKGLLVDSAEGAMIRKWMKKDLISERKIYIENLLPGFNHLKGKELSAAEKERCAELRVQVKFFNGALDYTTKEWEYLDRWVQKQSKKRAKEMFEKILSSYFGITDKYRNSKLKKYLSDEISSP